MKRSLSIGLNYSGTPNELGGCENDARDYSKRITGVKNNACWTTCSAATLVAYLRQIAEVSKPSDTFYFTFSGHGTQYPNGTEAIVLWTPKTGFEGLVDSDLRWLLAAIPGTVVAIFDSCFSGGLSRESQFPPRAEARAKFMPAYGIPIHYALNMPRGASFPNKLTYIAACAADEVSWDLGTNGFFTKAFCHEFDLMQRSQRSVGRLDLRVAELCIPKQTPGVTYIGGSPRKLLF